MRKIDHLVSFLAGLGIGLSAAILLAPEAGGKTRGRIRDTVNRAGDALKEHAENLSDAAGDFLEGRKQAWRDEQDEMDKTMSDMKNKTKQKIDNATDAAKGAADQIADKSKEFAHSAGKKMEEGGKRLQNA